MITALAGGVGAARFLEGLIKVIDNDELSVIVNTGDDIELYGLHISPDLDIVIYTLAGIVDDEKGWGIKGDTFNCLKALQRYSYDTWFMLGDKDLATHIHRTDLLKKGLKLSEVIDKECVAKLLINLSAGPLTVLPAIKGLIPTILALVSFKLSLTPGTERMVPMLTIGLLGQIIIPLAFIIESITPGAGLAFSIFLKIIFKTSS